MNDDDLKLVHHAGVVFGDALKATLELHREQLAALGRIENRLLQLVVMLEEQGKVKVEALQRMRVDLGLAPRDPATVRLLHVADDDGPREDA
jgi:hypothetical protein